jgi:hypothetical protein
MNILKFSENIKKIINENEFINTDFMFGYINKNNVMNLNINENTYNRFKDFISSKYEMKEKIQKNYYYNDIKLISINDLTHICVRSLPANYYDIHVRNDKYNNYGIRMIRQNNRIIDNINFPSIIKYDNIDINNITFCIIKFKNSEIILEFTENNNILSINLKTKIDKYNVNNFIQNFQFIISKLYMKKFNLDSSYKNNKFNSR